MLWAVLAATGACADAAYYIINKKFVYRLGPDLLAAAGFLFTSVFLLAASLYGGIPLLGPYFFLAVAATSAINIVGTTLIFRALQSTDISLAIPMLSFTPLFLVGTSALILHEFPSAMGIAGIIIIVAGSYILNTSEKHTRLLDPFRAMIAHPGIFSMLVVSFLYAVAINFDKMVVENSDPVFGSGLVYLVLGSAFLTIFGTKTYLAGRTATVPDELISRQSMDQFPGKLRDVAVAGISVGVFLALEAVVINEAYLIQIVPYVIAIKRMSIIITVLYGTLIFHEKGILRRASGAGLMVLGVALVLLFP